MKKHTFRESFSYPDGTAFENEVIIPQPYRETFDAKLIHHDITRSLMFIWKGGHVVEVFQGMEQLAPILAGDQGKDRATLRDVRAAIKRYVKDIAA